MEKRMIDEAQAQARLDQATARASVALWQAAVAFLREHLGPDTMAEIRRVLGTVDWPAMYHMGWGVAIRNALRRAGFGEQAFGILNLDNIYVPLVEEAVTPVDQWSEADRRAHRDRAGLPGVVIPASPARVTSVQGALPYADLPQYRSHKIVGALKIAAVSYDWAVAAREGRTTDGSAIISPESYGYPPFRVGKDYVDKHLTGHPGVVDVVGGYYVVYEDGYASWSPAEAFEAGYTAVL